MEGQSASPLGGGESTSGQCQGLLPGPVPGSSLGWSLEWTPAVCPSPPSLGPQLSFREQVTADALLHGVSLGAHADPGYGRGVSANLSIPAQPFGAPPNDALWVLLSLPTNLVHDWSGLAFVKHPGTGLTVPEWGHWCSRE